MTLQQKLDKIKVSIESSLQPDQVEIMHRATKELIDSQAESNVIQSGQKSPEWTLKNQEGEVVSLKDYFAKKPLVITFYRGHWCPYCNQDLSTLKEYHQEIADLGAEMIAISPELSEHSQETIQKYKLPFDILHDQGNEIAQGYGLRFRLPKDLEKLYSGFGIDLPQINGEGSWTLPMPGRFLIDQEGVIRYAEASADYTKRPDPDELIAQLKEMQA